MNQSSALISLSRTEVNRPASKWTFSFVAALIQDNYFDHGGS